MVTDLQEFFLRSDPSKSLKPFEGLTGQKTAPKTGLHKDFCNSFKAFIPQSPIFLCGVSGIN